MRVLVTGGAGFIGSHVAEYYARRDNEVVIYDNLSRARLLNCDDRNARHNWDYLGSYKNIRRVCEDVCNLEALEPHCRHADVIFHIAGQTAVTTSVQEPRPDFETNAMGTFNLLEAIRRSGERKTVVYCSTNKVYGDNVNDVELIEDAKRYTLTGQYKQGIPETFSVDHCKHTPYGCSKLTADLYMQEWARLYGHRIGVFRMSCIYGTRQFGFEDQGWVAWFVIAALKGRPITIYGDGKQVRDVLEVTDLVAAYDRFVMSDIPHGVFNTGGGVDNTLSLIELISMIEQKTGKTIPLKFMDWRPSDQKAYVSDIRKATTLLGWKPGVNPAAGVAKLFDWVNQNQALW